MLDPAIIRGGIDNLKAKTGVSLSSSEYLNSHRIFGYTGRDVSFLMLRVGKIPHGWSKLT